MKIIVDADSCPVKKQISQVAKDFLLKVLFIVSYSHWSNDFIQEDTIFVDSYWQAVDMEIINQTEKGDLIITQDLGLAALVLAKGAFVMSSNGTIYNQGNIDCLLERRHDNMKFLKAGGKLKGPSPLSQGDLIKFEKKMRKFIQEILPEEM